MFVSNAQNTGVLDPFNNSYYNIIIINYNSKTIYGKKLHFKHDQQQTNRLNSYFLPSICSNLTFQSSMRSLTRAFRGAIYTACNTSTQETKISREFMTLYHSHHLAPLVANASRAVSSRSRSTPSVNDSLWKSSSSSF